MSLRGVSQSVSKAGAPATVSWGSGASRGTSAVSSWRGTSTTVASGSAVWVWFRGGLSLCLGLDPIDGGHSLRGVRVASGPGQQRSLVGLRSGQRARVADEGDQGIVDVGSRRDAPGVGPRRVCERAEHVVTDGVECLRDARADLSRPQRLAAGLRGRRQSGSGDARPLAHQGGVQDAGEVDGVGRDPTRGQAVQSGIDREPDDLDGPVVVDQHVLRDQPTVRLLLVVSPGDRLGDLGDDPGRPTSRQRALGEEDVEGLPRAPLVDDVAEVVALVRVEDAQDPGVDDGRRSLRGVQQERSAGIGGPDHVEGHVAGQHLVVGTPEQTAGGLPEQVDHAVPVRDHVARPDRVRHVSPSA